jgi:hypothetical protein
MMATLAAVLAAVTVTARSQWVVDLGALGGTRTPSLLIRRLCHWSPRPGKSRLICPDGSHRFASLCSVARCCPARFRPALPRFPSMRTNGSAVGRGRCRRPGGRRRPIGRGRRQRGCCTFVLHVASSSRSQLLSRATSVTACSKWDKLSVGVRWRPLLSVAIVTHFVTRSRSRGSRSLAGRPT